MAQLSIEFCKKLARVRRERGITQSALARTVGCKQSAISMLESGQPEKIAHETVVKIAELLEVTMPTPPTAQPPTFSDITPLVTTKLFCPNALCLSNAPYLVGEELLFWPRPQPATATPPRHCATCGELLEHTCPHCGAAAPSAGGCCTACGGAMVINTLPAGVDRVAWSTERRREIAALLELL